MAEKVHKCNVKREQGFLYYIDSRGNVGRFRRGGTHKEIICPNGGEFTKEAGWMYYLDKDGDVSRSRMKSFREYAEVKDEIGEEVALNEKNWLKGAINPSHKGFCTPMTKSTCTPRRKALAKRFKSGDLHHDKKD